MQIAKSFCKETLVKIGKGALIAATGGAALAVLDYFGTLQIENSALVGLIAWGVPTLTNIIREWMKGTKV
jgi:hypothetical protein